MTVGDIYIKLLVNASKTESHELLLDLMSYYKVYALRQLTEEQLRDYCKLVGVI